MTRFEQLCKDFEKRRPRLAPAGEIPWFNVKWENGDDSVNDLLIRFLRENDIEYLHTFNGDIWFLYHDVWECCTYEVKDGWVHFYMCKFVDY